MAQSSHRQLVNPRLGRYFGIFASFIFSLIIMLLIFEQLGTSKDRLSYILLLSPLAAYMVIGIIANATDPLDFYASGRRVPAFFNGLGISIASFGATGLVTLTGLFYLIGFDAFAIAIGIPAGILLMAVAITPYLRKHGSYTIAGYFAHRFQSRLIRPLLALAFAVPAILIITAELRMLARVGALLFDQPATSIIAAALGITCTTLLFGGMRAQSWSGSAQAIVALIGVLITVFIVATIQTNLPLPQITYATMMKYVARADTFFDITAQTPGFLDVLLPGTMPEVLTKPYSQAFGALGTGSFALLMLVVMCGVASMPACLTRTGTSVSVFETRKSMVWAVVIIGVVVLLLPAIAVFTRYLVFSTLANIPSADAPDWLQRLSDYGFAFYDTSNAQLSANQLKISRDGVLLMLPMISKMPDVLVVLTAAGIMAAALACLSLQLLTLANSLSEDVALGFRKTMPKATVRLLVSRASLVLTAILLGGVASQVTLDPLWLMLWAFAISASTVLPALIISVWWKRANKWGVVAGAFTGLGLSLSYIYATTFLGFPKIMGLDAVFAPVFAIPAALVITSLVSLITPRPNKTVLNIIRDIRVPGGETFHDREERLARVERRRRKANAN